MATDFSKPVVGDGYASLIPGINQTIVDLGKMLEPTDSGAHTNVPTNTRRWNKATFRLELWNGTSWVENSSQYNFSNIVLAGALAFTGVGNRITGDFSNGTFANRVMFQSSPANSGTNLGVIPNGSSVNASTGIFNNSNPDNGSALRLVIDSSAAHLESAKYGTGTYLPLAVEVGGAEAMRISTGQLIGMGRTPTAFRLELDGDMKIIPTNPAFSALYRMSSNAGDACVGLGAATDSVPYALNLFHGGAYPIVFTTSGSERMRLDAVGKLGLGIVPAYKLDVQSVLGSIAGAARFSNSASAGANSGIFIDARPGTTHYNWMLGAQVNTGAAFEITPSTAVNGTTFSTPVFTVSQAGSATIAGNLTVSGGTVNATNFTGNAATATTAAACSGNAATATSLATIAAGGNYFSPLGFAGTLSGVGSYVEVGNTQIVTGGTFRVYMQNAIEAGNPSRTARIYKNGAAYGTLRSFNGSTANNWSEDLAFSATDTMQIFTDGIISWLVGVSVTGRIFMGKAAIGDRA